MQNLTKDQHIVPVCYLRNFCGESEQGKKDPKVWCYDKFSRRSYFKGVKSICYSNKMYSIKSTSEPIIDKSIDDKETIFESHYLHDIEQEYSSILKNVIECLSQRKFGGDQKLKLSTFITIQYLRDPIIKGLCSQNDEPFFRLTTEYQRLIEEHPEIKDDPSMMHYMYAYGNKDLIIAMTKAMATYVWTFFYDKNAGFYTSDNPLCLAYEKTSDGMRKEHLLFPISKKILLQITKGVQIDEVMFVEDTPQWKVDYFNFIQVYYAKKYVVSSKNSFANNEFIRGNDVLMWDLKKMKVYK